MIRIPGPRAARRAALLVSLALAVFFVLVLVRLAQRVTTDIGPSLLTQLGHSLQREISAGDIAADEPGLLLLKDLRVSRGRTFSSGVWLKADELRVTYDPALTSLQGWLAGKIAGQTRAHLVMKGLELNTDAPHPLEEVLTASRLESDLDLGPLLARRPAAELFETINQVRVEAPFLHLVRDRRNRWSLEKIWKSRPDLAGRGFRGEVQVRNGSVQVRDLMASGARAVKLTGRLNATLRFAGFPQISATAAGELSPHRLAFGLTGWYDTRRRRLTAALRTHTRDGLFWVSYSGLEHAAAIRQQGELTAAGFVSGTPGKLRFDGSVRGRAIAGRLPGLPGEIEVRQGELRIAGQVESLKAAGSYGGLPAGIEMTFRDGAPRSATIDFRWRGRSVSTLRQQMPAELKQSLRLPGELRLPHATSGRLTAAGIREGSGFRWRLNLEARSPAAAFGSFLLNQPELEMRADVRQGRVTRADGQIESRRLSRGSLQLQAAVARFVLAGRKLGFDSSARLDGVPVTGRGRVDLSRRGPLLYALFETPGSSLSRVMPGISTDLKDLDGIAAGRVAVSGPLADPGFEARFEIRRLRWKEHSFPDAVIHAGYRDGLVTLHSLRARQDEAMLAAAGNYTNRDGFDLKFELSGLHLSRLDLPDAWSRLSGRISAKGSLRGHLPNILAEGSVSAGPAGFDNRRFSYIEGRYRYEAGNQLTLTDLRAGVPPGRLSSSRLEFHRTGDDWSVEGEVKAERLVARQVLELLPAGAKSRPLIAGDLDELDLRIAGRLQQPVIHLSGRGSDIHLPGVRMSQAQLLGLIHLDQGRLRIALDSRDKDLPGVSAAVSARIEQDENGERRLADLSISGRTGSMQVGRLVAHYLPDLPEWLAVNGTISGGAAEIEALESLDDQLAAGEGVIKIGASHWTIAGLNLDLQPLEISIKDRLVRLTDVSGELDGAPVELRRVSYRLPPTGEKGSLRRAAFELIVRELRLASLLKALDESADPADRISPEVLRVIDRIPRSTQHRLNVALSAAPDPSDAAGHMAGAPPPGLLKITASGTGAGGSADEEELPFRWRLQADQTSTELRVAEFHSTWRDGAVISAAGTISLREESQPVQADVIVSGVKLQHLAGSFLAVPETLQPLDGELSGRLTLSGPRSSPEMRGALALREGRLGGVSVAHVAMDDFAFTPVAGGWILSAGRLLALRQEEDGGEVSLRGSVTIPLDRDFRIAVDRPRRLRLSLPEQPVSVLRNMVAERQAALDEAAGAADEAGFLARLLASIADIRGSLSGTVELAGTAARPVNTGSLQVRIDRLQFLGLETALSGVTGEIRLNGNTLQVAGASATSSAGGGRIELSGAMRLPGAGGQGDLEFRAALRDFHLRESDLGRFLPAAGPTSARAVLNSVAPARPGLPGELTITGTARRPLIAGELRLDQAFIQPALREAPAPPAPPDALPFDPEFDLQVGTGRPIRVSNRLLRADLSGSVRISRRLSALRVAGLLSVEAGRIDLPAYPLRSLTGDVRVAYDRTTADLEPGLPIYLDLEARAPSEQLQRSLLEPPETYEVTLFIRGRPGLPNPGETAFPVSPASISPAGGLTVTIRSDPPLPGGRIEALIRQRLGFEGITPGAGNVESALGDQLQLALGSSISSVLTRPIENLLQTALGLDFASIQLDMQRRVRIQIGRRLFGRFYGNLSQSLGGAGGAGGLPYQSRIYEVYYRLSKRLRVGYRHLEPYPRDNQIFVSGSFSFR